MMLKFFLVSSTIELLQSWHFVLQLVSTKNVEKNVGTFLSKIMSTK